MFCICLAVSTLYDKRYQFFNVGATNAHVSLCIYAFYVWKSIYCIRALRSLLLPYFSFGSDGFFLFIVWLWFTLQITIKVCKTVGSIRKKSSVNNSGTKAHRRERAEGRDRERERKRPSEVYAYIEIGRLHNRVCEISFYFAHISPFIQWIFAG